MVLVAGLLVVGLALGVAAWFVVREAGRLTHEPPPVVFSLDEVYAWVVEELPDDVAATLTPDDVRRILQFVVEYLDRAAVSGANGSVAQPPTIVGPAEVVDHVLDRAEADGEPYIPEQVYPVIEIVLDYLAATGAVSTPAEAPADVADRPSDADPPAV